jgi:nucleoprotein TPR
VEHEKMADAYSLMNQKLQHSLNENSNLEKTILELKVCIMKYSFIRLSFVTYRFCLVYLLQAYLKRHEREYNLAQKEIDDLRKQVNRSAPFIL